MSKRSARILLAGPAAVLVAVLGATAALAATTWTVRPGGAITAKAGKTSLTDTRTGTTATCGSVTASGTLKSGSGLSGTGIGSFSAVSFRNCTGPLGITFTLRATDLPWHINLTSYNPTTGVVTGTISHVQLKLSAPSCSATIDGTSSLASNGVIKFTYTNRTHVLKPLSNGGNLHVFAVSGCAGLFNNGDPVTVNIRFTLSPGQTITSP